jgi:hypothetical protein
VACNLSLKSAACRLSPRCACNLPYEKVGGRARGRAGGAGQVRGTGTPAWLRSDDHGLEVTAKKKHNSRTAVHNPQSVLFTHHWPSLLWKITS